EFAHFREHLPAPVAEFLDPLVDQCRGRLRRDGPFHVQLHFSHLLYVKSRLTGHPAAVRGQALPGLPCRPRPEKDESPQSTPAAARQPPAPRPSPTQTWAVT